ncbi:hypothetical protein FSARC_3646 [Fusarium sarcochroum]|uniref:Uncharacterized protein n=1 Tax=Fusarium sarcochroum TaxID=1208366 RepID=A0A8H4U3I3_9HYPO|nr:hypothetical protein FSARC_3646 [Fusarium sarcochroum]
MSDSKSSASETVSEEADIPDIAAKIDRYRKSMEAKLDGWRIHPWKEHNRDWEPRLQIFHLDQGAGNYTTPNLDRRNNPQHLWQDLEEALGEEVPSKPYQRLILLEGMDPRVAEALSIKLNIPPEFWLTHYRGDGELRPLNPSGGEYTSSTYWKVRASMRLPIVWNKDISTAKRFSPFIGSCYRGSVFSTPGEKFLDSYTHVSFWGKYTANGWIALVLMDVSVGFLVPWDKPDSETPGFFLLQAADRDFIPYFPKNLYAIVGPQSSESSGISPYAVSLWDMVIQAYEKEAIITTDDPFSATTIIRNFIFLKCESSIDQVYGVRNTILVSRGEDRWNPLSIPFQDRNHALGRNEEIAAEYQELRVWRRRLQHMHFLFRHISQAFRCNDNEYLHAQTDKTLRVLSVQESRRWTNLLEHIRFIDGLISENMAMYAQRAAMEEAFTSRSQPYDTRRQSEAANERAAAAAANRMARSSAQLVKIATVAVLCAVAASVFSMNGGFAAGERFFFVYGCVALPLTVVLLCWAIQKDSTEWRRERGTNEQGIRASEEPGYQQRTGTEYETDEDYNVSGDDYNASGDDYSISDNESVDRAIDCGAAIWDSRSVLYEGTTLEEKRCHSWELFSDDHRGKE